jgi:hypothetical protein
MAMETYASYRGAVNRTTEAVMVVQVAWVTDPSIDFVRSQNILTLPSR